MQSLPVFGLGLACSLAGVALFALTLRKSAPTSAPLKKSEQRAQAVEQSNTNKLRVAGAVLTVGGAILMLLS